MTTWGAKIKINGQPGIVDKFFVGMDHNLFTIINFLEGTKSVTSCQFMRAWSLAL